MISETLRHRMVAIRESNRFDPAQLDRIQQWIEAAPDEALFRVNPISFAVEQKISERDAIDFFVHAARAGIFDFAWGLICPGCTGFLSARGGIRDAAATRACSICALRAGETLDNGVEVSFTVNPAVRRVRFHGGWSALADAGRREQLADDALRLYFSHAVADDEVLEFFRRSLGTVQVVPRNTPTPLRFELDGHRRGMWRLVTPAVHAVCNVEIDPAGPATASVQLIDGRALPEVVQLRPGPVEIQLVHRLDEPELLVGMFCLDFSSLDHGSEDEPEDAFETETPPTFLSGRRLLSTQSFRDLFRTETLPPDGSLEIRALAMLFTDLKASTQMYERVGDLKALDLVRQHFALLRDVVARHEGAIVKTIGDAVMATFDDPVKAAAAAVEMHQVLQKVPELQLKVGVHVGPCVAVDSNERIDYFGQTVNIAARVQALADGREVVFTDVLLRSPGVAELLKRSSLKLSEEQVMLKGIDQPVTVHRTTVA